MQRAKPPHIWSAVLLTQGEGIDNPRKESRSNSLRHNKVVGFFFLLHINDYSLAYKNERWETADVLKTTLYILVRMPFPSSKATLCSCKDSESRMLKAFCYSFCSWTAILKAEQYQENRNCSQGQNWFTWQRAATSLALWLDAGFAVQHQFVSSPYVQIDGTPSWRTEVIALPFLKHLKGWGLLINEEIPRYVITHGYMKRGCWN